MLRSLRKFTSSPYAKVVMAIVILPFIFWGMGPVFQGGKQNTIAEIGNKKISTQEFINFVQYTHDPENETLDKNLIEELLGDFIGKKLATLEIENFGIKLSDNSLSAIIKNEKVFKKNNKFSRTEYEKFLVKNSLNAISFETNISEQEKRLQLLDFIGGGIMPPNFLVSMDYNKINQKRNVEVINLNDIFNQKLKFSENQIELYFDQNKDAYKDIYKTIKFVKLNPKNLTVNNEFNDLFFKKIDEIDDLIVEGKNLDFILNRYNLGSFASSTFNKLGINENSETNIDFPGELVQKIFNIDETEPTVLIEHEDKYLVVEVTKTENIQKKVSDESVKKEILFTLEKQTKRKLISEIISKINNDNFKKADFDKLSKDENVIIKKVKLESLNDDKVLKHELLKQIYAFSENKVIVVADVNLSESFLVYIDKIENTSIDKNSENYNKYFNISQNKTTSSLYNTYDSYLKRKYKININYKALDRVKNSIQ